MKPTSIARAELHTLVWTEPRSKLADILGISDVAIGKLCVRENIPAPPRGYWTKKAAGGRTAILPLPIRLPGQRNQVELRSKNDYGSWNIPIDLDEKLVPPFYYENIDEVVESALKQLGPYRSKRDLSAPHHGLRRLLRSEANRAEKLSKQAWTFDKPRYLEPRFQRQLKIFNSIFYILDAIVADCEVSERSIWIQGTGHIHYLVAGVAIGKSGVELLFLEPENPKSSNELPRSAVTTLRIGDWERKVVFSDTAAAKIELRLEGIVKTILELLENQMRSVDKARYDNKLERRETHLK